MTMLDRMRRHRGWLKWSLALVILTFAFFFVPTNNTMTAGSPDQVIADVEGETVTVAQFQRRYSLQMQQYRNAYGGQISEQMLRQLGIDQQILQGLVDEQAMVAEARRQKFSVSDVEVRQRILSLPAFMENGTFIGETRYRQLLSTRIRRSRPRNSRTSCAAPSWPRSCAPRVTGWMSVPEKPKWPRNTGAATRR